MQPVCAHSLRVCHEFRASCGPEIEINDPLPLSVGSCACASFDAHVGGENYCVLLRAKPGVRGKSNAVGIYKDTCNGSKQRKERSRYYVLLLSLVLSIERINYSSIAFIFVNIGA